MKYIKRVFCATALILGTVIGSAQSQAEASPAGADIKAVEQVQLKKSGYRDAAEFWQNQTMLNNKNADAWLNYYKAVRYGDYTEKSRKISSATELRLSQIIKDMEKHVGASFAFHYASYLQKNKSSESFVHLENAFLLRPDEPELWDDMLCKSVIEKNSQQISLFARKLSESAVYSASELEYNRNVLNSLEQNAILITHGNVDTYPLIILQQVQNFRQDVKIICLDWFNNAAYLKNLADSDPALLGKLSVNQPYESLNELVKRSEGKALYLALTIPADVIGDLSNNLYCTGLSVKYSKTALNNIPSLDNNWKQLFSKNYITSGETINKNYVLPLVLLYDYYRDSGQTQQAESVRSLLQTLGSNFGMQAIIQKQID